MKFIFTILILLVTGIHGYSQEGTSRKALAAYNNMLYSEAAQLYQSIVNKTGGNQEELLNLATTYMKLQQYIDAELTFKKLFEKFPAQSQQTILKYAQTLAANQMYEEATVWYDKYTADGRGKAFADSYRDLNKYYRDSSNVTTIFLPVNTTFSEYSPVIYESGIIFCSNRNTNSPVKREYGGNKTPYTDIYQLLDASTIKDHWVTTKAINGYKDQLADKSNNPDLTPQTSNDSRTLGNYSQDYMTGNVGAKESSVEVSKFNSAINSKYHEGPACFTKNYDTIFFTRNSYYKGKTEKGHDKVTRLQIFFATLGPDGTFENIQPFPFNHPDHSIGHPAISPDGRRLYFVSDRAGGRGETDIYYSEIREHRFTEPVNAGAVINTMGSEMFPSFNKDGSLFFSSNGHAGLGGLDIFRSDFANNQFQTPENLRYPMNSSKDDFGISSSDNRGAVGYFSSNRVRGRADDNIYAYSDNRPQRIKISGTIKAKHTDDKGKEYVEPVEGAVVSLSPEGDKITTDRTGRFEFVVDRGRIYTIEGEKEKLGKDRKDVDLLKPSEKRVSYNVDLLLDIPVLTLLYTGKVLDDKMSPVKDAVIYLYDMESAKAQKVTTDTSGNFAAALQPNHTYIMKSNAEGHFSDCYRVYVSPTASTPASLDNFQLKKIQVNTTFEVKNLLYDYKMSDIREDAAAELDKVVSFLKAYPEIVVELGSHTDSRGNDAYNQTLSAERANAAVNYIIGHGIDSSRISAKGYGETMLVNKCKNNVNCTEDLHQQNRRTEFKVTGIVAAPAKPEQAQVTDTNGDPMNIFKSLSDFTDCKVLKVGN